MHRGSHGSSSTDVRTDKDHHKDSKDQREGKESMGRPRAGSESSRNPVSKVMDLIRHRSHSALSSEDKRKAVSNFTLSFLFFPTFIPNAQFEVS